MRGSRGFDVASNRHSFAAKRTSFTKKRDLSEKVRGEFSSTLESGIEMTTFWGCSPSIFFFFFKFARGFPGVPPNAYRLRASPNFPLDPNLIYFFRGTIQLWLKTTPGDIATV